MSILRFAASFSILAFLSLFVQANLFQVDFTSGTFGATYLYAAMLSFIVAIVSAGDIASFFKLKKSIFVLVTFLCYTFAKYHLETDEFLIRQVTIGTTQGLLFYLLVGLATSYAIFTLYNLQRTEQWSRIITFATIIYLLYLLLSLYLLVIEGLSATRSDQLRVDDEITYQRPADLLFLQLIMATSLAYLIVIKPGQFRITKFIVLILCVTSIAVLTALLAQLIGSNKGALGSAGVTIVYLTCSFTSLFAHAGQSIGISNIIFSRTSVYLIGGLILASIITTGIVLGALSYFQIDYTQTRLLGYGVEEDGLVSITSRSEIFRQNFIRHFIHSPIFGHTQIHQIIDGHNGIYVHSTLSILPHLGIVGFLLFLLLIVSMYFEMTRGNSNNRLDILPNNGVYGLFRLAMLSLVIAIGISSAFFTWSPLWFSIGFFGTWFGFRASSTSLNRKKRGKRRKKSKQKPQRRENTKEADRQYTNSAHR